ncbi:hypothetical protein GF325_06835 [Candidatus Bathyarchaeota archaeon]|nr:hypothetical protein [Candidatus Bathyarchaeota archaeon]
MDGMNMAKSASRRKMIAITILFSTLAAITGMISVFTVRELFPDNDGFNRTITYIRPATAKDTGYFIIVDEFKGGNQVELVFHSYGNLTVNASIGKAWFNQDGVEMLMQFIGPGVTISKHEGGVFKTYPGNPSNTIEEYIKVKPIDRHSRRLVTLVTFQNSSISHPSLNQNLVNGGIELLVNGSDRILIPRHEMASPATIKSSGITADCKMCVMRENATGLKWLLFHDADSIAINGTKIHEGSHASGFFNATLNATMPAGKGQGTPSIFSSSTPTPQSILESLSHPYALFNDGELSTIRGKCNGTITGPWQAWYNKVKGKSDVLSLAFRSRVDQDDAMLSDVVMAMLDLENNYETIKAQPWEDTQFIEQSTYLYPFLLAYDMIYNNISVTNRSIIEGIFTNKIKILADVIASGSQPTNNHIVVASTALGIGGIVLKNASWVELTQDANDFYLENRIRPNGACYEGAIYGRYTYEQAVKFFLALRNIGGYDYFTNERFLSYLNYTASSVTPLGWTPVFEDCAVKSHLAHVASMCVAPTNISNPALASNLQWYMEYCYEGDTTIGADACRILAYSGEIAPLEPELGENPGFAYFDTGYMVMRSGWSRNDTFLVISNKHYPQSHVHLDENSIEIYALGKKFLTNPGYPHWGYEGHDYTISTEASNTILINGEGQLDIISDGFNQCIQNGILDFIESPCHVAYQSPFAIGKNHALLIPLLVVVCSLVACALHAIYSIFREDHVDLGNARSSSTNKDKKNIGNDDTTGGGTITSVFAFSETKLESYDFQSRKHMLQVNALLACIQCASIVPIFLKLVNYITFQVHYIHLNAGLKETIYALTPLARILTVTILPVVLLGLNALVFVFHALQFRLYLNRWDGESVSFREAQGVIYKQFVPRFVVQGIGFVLNLFYVLPTLLAALLRAQVDAGNNISIGIYLRNLLNGYMIYFLVLGGISVPFHLIGMKSIDAFAMKQHSNPRNARRAFTMSFLVIVAIGAMLLFISCVFAFEVLSTITIENNPLQ